MNIKRILSVLFLTLLVGIFGVNLFTEDRVFSLSERKELASKPEWNMDSLLEGTLSEEYSEYVNDQFFMRDTFRHIQALTEYYFFQRDTINGVYYDGESLYNLMFEQNDELLETHIKNINNIIEHYNRDASLMLIPSSSSSMDQNYLINQEELANEFSKQIDAEYLNLFDLDLEYYQTDPHWLSSSALNVFKTYFQSKDYTYTFEMIDENYQGSLLGKSGLPEWLFQDEVMIPHNKIIDQLKLTRTISGTETVNQIGPYVIDELDSYDTFLGGNAPIVTLENEQGNGKHLLVFRDSFASSLAPFLAQEYSKVTLVDMRLVSINYVYTLIEPNDELELLFAFSIETLNDNYLLTNN